MSSTDRLRGGLDTSRVHASDRDRARREQQRAAAARVITARLDDQAAGEVLAALGLDQKEATP